MWRFVACVLIGCLPSVVAAAEIAVSTDAKSGMLLYEVTQGETVVRFAPTAGANVFSIQVGGVEYLRQPESLDQLPGVGYGNPVLYPTPNRVKDAQFTFAGDTLTGDTGTGDTVRFEPNAGKNFIHGLVNRHTWDVVSVQSDAASASIRCLASFESGSALHHQFPFAHQLFLTIEVRDAAVRWQYEVDNVHGAKAVPFGFALHPYIVYQGDRSETYLTIPATHWMESTQQLPSGKLIPASELDYPLGTPMSLEKTSFDDVFWGMRPEAPTLIDFRDQGRQIEIRASAEFTHLVVWTPDRPYFGIESQTCSTDAHNLHAAGLKDAAHLQICPPGKTLSGWVEYAFK